MKNKKKEMLNIRRLYNNCLACGLHVQIFFWWSFAQIFIVKFTKFLVIFLMCAQYYQYHFEHSMKLSSSLFYYTIKSASTYILITGHLSCRVLEISRFHK